MGVATQKPAEILQRLHRLSYKFSIFCTHLDGLARQGRRLPHAVPCSIGRTSLQIQHFLHIPGWSCPSRAEAPACRPLQQQQAVEKPGAAAGPPACLGTDFAGAWRCYCAASCGVCGAAGQPQQLQQQRAPSLRLRLLGGLQRLAAARPVRCRGYEQVALCQTWYVMLWGNGRREQCPQAAAALAAARLMVPWVQAGSSVSDVLCYGGMDGESSAHKQQRHLLLPE
eukprot:1145700-Pelagomonas_calceolata.AAC.1